MASGIKPLPKVAGAPMDTSKSASTPFRVVGMFIPFPPPDCESQGSLLWLSNHDICPAIGQIFS